jgi:hypothetical protein
MINHMNGELTITSGEVKTPRTGPRRVLTYKSWYQSIFSGGMVEDYFLIKL